MTRRRACLVSPFLLATFAACSGTSTPLFSTELPEDAGTHAEADANTRAIDSGPFGDDNGADSGGVRASNDGGDATTNPPNDAAHAPDGNVSVTTTLDATGGAIVLGITTDDYVIYAVQVTDEAGTRYAINVVSAAGGTPTTLAADNSRAALTHDGKTIFVWDDIPDPSADNLVGSLSIWTSAHGLVPLVAAPDGTTPGGSAIGVSAATADGSYVMYTANTSVDGTSADLLGASASSPGTPATLLEDTAVGAACYEALGFVGNAAIYAECIPADGSSGTNIDTFAYANSTTWAKTTLVTDGTSFTGSPDGTKLATFSKDNSLRASAPNGSGQFVVDVGVWETFFAADSTLYYTTTPDGITGTLYSSNATAAGSTQRSVTGGFLGFASESPNGSDLIGWDTQNPANAYLADVTLAPLGGSATTATTTLTAANDFTSYPFAATFTADSSHAIWADAYDASSGTGNLYSAAIATPATTTRIATGVSLWGNAGGGAQIVYGDNQVAGAGTEGNATLDLHTVNTANPTLIRDLTTSINARFQVNAAGTKVIYGDASGLHATTIPTL